MNKVLKPQLIIVIVLVIVVFLFQSCCLNWYFGYKGYGKDKQLRQSYSLEESISRKVYIRTLKMEILENDSNVVFDSSKRYKYLEYNYRWGKFSGNKTRIDSTGEFPYHFGSDYKSIRHTTFLYFKYVGDDKSLIYFDDFLRITYCKRRNFDVPLRFNVVDRVGNVYAKVQFKQ